MGGCILDYLRPVLPAGAGLWRWRGVLIVRQMSIIEAPSIAKRSDPERQPLLLLLPLGLWSERRGMTLSTRSNVENAVGQWVQFRTPWGYHRGIVEQVNQRAVLVKVPKEYAPISLAYGSANGAQNDAERLNTALTKHNYRISGDVTPAFGGYGPGYGPGAGGAPGGRWGYPGYGDWGGGWWWWWLAFAWIFLFAFWFW